MIAMLKQFAPNAVTPPSPKNSAWISSATDTASIDPHGPNTIVAMPMPTAWPVVPPGNGKLNIIITNENAEKTASSGTRRVFSRRRTRWSAIYQNGAAATYKVAQVDGLR